MSTTLGARYILYQICGHVGSALLAPDIPVTVAEAPLNKGVYPES